jgi:NAD-dependent deacetylase
LEAAIGKVQELIAGARDVLCFTGAGVSTASSIPDYRGPRGVWRTRAPVYYQAFVSSEAARIEYWDFKLDGYAAFRDARPNPAHEALVEIERRGKLRLLATQNIDGLHAEAGSSPDKLVELHGSGRFAVCLGCERRETMAVCLAGFEATHSPPCCASCGGIMKPAVVMFGESLVAADFARAMEAARTCDLVLSLGSSLTVTPAADVPLAAARRGVPYAIVNQGATPHDSIATVTIDGDVGSVLQSALQALV